LLLIVFHVGGDELGGVVLGRGGDGGHRRSLSWPADLDGLLAARLLRLPTIEDD
jgi:hypothetical protein